jgi:hypothetical protein
MSYVFTCRAQQPLASNRSNLLGFYTVRSRRLMWRWRLTWSRKLTWSRRILRRTTVRRTTVRRRWVQDRGEASSRSSIG